MTPRRARRISEGVKGMDLQVPLLAAKALLLLLLFAFIYAVVRRGIGDLRPSRRRNLRAGKEPEDDGRRDRPERRSALVRTFAPPTAGTSRALVVEDSTSSHEHRVRVGRRHYEHRPFGRATSSSRTTYFSGHTRGSPATAALVRRDACSNQRTFATRARPSAPPL